MQSRPSSRLLHKLCTSGACGNVPLIPIMAMGSVGAGTFGSDICIGESVMREGHLGTGIPDDTSFVVSETVPGVMDISSSWTTARGGVSAKWGARTVA